MALAKGTGKRSRKPIEERGFALYWSPNLQGDQTESDAAQIRRAGEAIVAEKTIAFVAELVERLLNGAKAPVKVKKMKVTKVEEAQV